MAQKLHLPKNLAKLHSGTIPDKVAQVARQDQNYLISFKHYREDLCEIDLLDKNKPKECIKVFKRASQASLGKLNEKNIDRIPIKNSGEYKKLFNRLTNEVSLYEHKVQNTARIFYFVSAHEFHVIAITNNHFETDKVRR
jgi:hypothetical protein